ESIVIKNDPFILKEKSPDLGLETIRNILNLAIKNNRYVRIRYTRAAWTETIIDEYTGEIITNITDAEESVRTINDVHLSVDVLDDDHISRYNLNENYITAYCNRREAQRTFRFDRISEIEILNI
ncbi:MAG: WYL domain-containing protein, partial [Anaerolineales bacterium]|nr:WYL domain-containing protein [Anaerolineales bacterium]